MSEEPVHFRERWPWWGGDLQTLRSQVVAQHVPLPSRSTLLKFPTSDGSGDQLAGRLDRPVVLRPSPLILLIHGLTGSQESTYVRDTARFHLERGRCVLRLNLRGAGPGKELARNYYHAGCAGDLEDVLKVLPSDIVRQGVFAIGFSLGGNVLLNLLAHLSDDHRLIGAATVSAPIEPFAACQRIMSARNWFYHQFLLKHMKRDVLSSAIALTPAEQKRLVAIKTLYDFDDQFIAPRNGFADALDYYVKTAGAQFVPHVPVPTLMLHASNDPWIPDAPYRRLQAKSLSHVTILLARGGGHVGFHEQGFKDTWFDRQIERFLTSRLAAPRHVTS